MEKRLILVIDDEKSIADNFCEIIKRTGRYEVQASYSAKEGFEQLEKNKRFLGFAENRIKCIILDIKMPEVDGLEFLKTLRANESWFQIIPVIIISAYEDREKWSKATSPARGMIAAYLKKTVNEEKLIDTIDRIFAGEAGRMIDETREKKYDKWDSLGEKD